MQQPNTRLSRQIIYNLTLGALFGAGYGFFFAKLELWSWLLWVPGLSITMGLIEVFGKACGLKGATGGLSPFLLKIAHSR
jgi:hypothetical protein